MKLSISNIAWAQEDNDRVYALLQELGYEGLEIAPTKLFPEAPYEHISEAALWGYALKEKYGLAVSSMQSIWYGRQEKVFGTPQERQTLIQYTKKAVRFAAALGCGNLVFGCPKNRAIPHDADPAAGVAFFHELGEYARSQGTVIGLEANPPIYGTNYINNTLAALEVIRKADSWGLLLNLDVGTMVENQEPVSILRGNVCRISHVHISEPFLKRIVPRKLHEELGELLRDEDYRGWVSIEMGQGCSMEELHQTLTYVSNIFGK